MTNKQGVFIFLHDNVESYFPGQTISGKVVVNILEKPKEFKYISISCEGKAKVHWTESRTRTTGTGNNRRTEHYTVRYSNSEDYFSYRAILLGNVDSGTVSLPPGSVTYPFQFVLPVGIPSSYSSSTGMVQYTLEARMKRAWYKPDLTFVRPFSVNGILDLNTQMHLAVPVSYEKQKTLCCLWCASGPIKYQISLPQTGFVPGQCVDFNAAFTNQSSRGVNGVDLMLIQNVAYHSREGKTRHETKIVCTKPFQAIEPGQEKFWRGADTLRIPPLPPTGLACCRIIDVQYQLKFVVDISGPATNLKAKIPITIGTIPFRNTFGSLMPGGFAGPSPSAPPPPPGPSFGHGDADGSFPSAPILTMYPDLPPPSYAEATGTDNFIHNNDAADGEGPPPDYNPRYITYGFVGDAKLE